MHAHARGFSAASICADGQARFWDMHERLFDEQPRRREFLITMASQLGFRIEAFAACLDNVNATDDVIARDLAIAKRLGINSTPTFALGIADARGRISVRKLISGAQPFEIFAQELEPFLIADATD
jgi:protein-disulfide isomerase